MHFPEVRRRHWRLGSRGRRPGPRARTRRRDTGSEKKCWFTLDLSSMLYSVCPWQRSPFFWRGSRISNTNFLPPNAAAREWDDMSLSWFEPTSVELHRDPGPFEGCSTNWAPSLRHARLKANALYCLCLGTLTFILMGEVWRRLTSCPYWFGLGYFKNEKNVACRDAADYY